MSAINKVLFLVCLIISISCGDDNTAPPPGGGPSPIGGPNPIIPGPGGEQGAELSILVSQFVESNNCTKSPERMNFYFHVPISNTPISQYDPMGLNQNGFIQNRFPAHNNSTVERAFVGIHPPFNDIIVVTDLSDGVNIVAREVYVSICTDPDLFINVPSRYDIEILQLSVDMSQNCRLGNVRGSILINAAAFEQRLPFRLRETFINTPNCFNGN